ncbi:hypothetical protein GIB67_027608 [Kingdonia uniflora]|uniref:Ethylene-insensitive protein 2 n=1 Tax=Kingdonia uniflora TaxID=39325 RepID=A0A7J7NLD5_9MAGN|nr:hypothetical protein GIB67_027608 [Kingdonia uniflora]
MEAGMTCVKEMSGIVPRLFPTVGPILLIAVGYVDPGKWSAVVEGGSRFGFDLALLILAFNCTAILCHYLAACISVVTGKNLAQICSEEYSKSTCIILGVQAELSVIVLDLTMILGIAHGLNLLLGVNLVTGLLLTATDAVLFPFLSILLEKSKSEILFISTAGFILISYMLGIILSQSEIPLGMNGVLARLSGESAFVLMSLLGSNIMPHNFYVHSAIVQKQQQGSLGVSKSGLCQEHFFAILCVFSGVFLANYLLMNLAATVFHSAGLVVLTFQDILFLMDQVFRSPIAPLIFFLVLFISSHITTLTWILGGQAVLHDLFKMDLPVWLHRAAIRTFVIVVSVCCTWYSGAEGIYQLLIFSQVVLALTLPSSVVPLFRVASSRSIMGAFRISQLLEFISLTTLIGMLGLNIIFVVELCFGNSEWVGNLKWNMGSSMVLPYVVLLTTSCASLVMMLWLAATPLKSATVRQDEHLWDWELKENLPELYLEGEENDTGKGRYHVEDHVAVEETPLEQPVPSTLDCSSVEFEFDLPESVLDSNHELQIPPIEENFKDFVPKVESDSATIIDKVVADVGTIQNIASLDPIVKDLSIDKDSRAPKDDDDGDIWEIEELPGGDSVSGPPSTSEGPGSFRSLSLKNDEGGSGNGSLSRLSGLGRAGRRQFTTILDEFWGQLYDFHGQATQEAKAKKLDIFFVLETKSSASVKIEPTNMGSLGFYPSVADRGPGYLINSNMYDSSLQQWMPSSIESSSPYGLHTGSSSWSSRSQLPDAYIQNSSSSGFDISERRYSSLRLPQTSQGWDYQPATVHGYQLSSYLNKISTDRNLDPVNNLLDSPTTKSLSSTPFYPANYRDPLTYYLGQKTQNQINIMHAASSVHNPVISRPTRLQAERPYYDPSLAVGPGEDVGSPAYTKKYHSLPDISGLAVPLRDSANDRSSKWNGPPGFGPSVAKKAYEHSLYTSSGSRTGVRSSFDEFPQPSVHRDALSVQISTSSDTTSLWSTQPFEQLFGVAGKTSGVGGGGIGSRLSLSPPKSVSYVDPETSLLQSFRYCIMRILKLEGCDWLFRYNGGVDEELIDRVAARERYHYEAETREINQMVRVSDSQYPSSEKKLTCSGSALKNQEAGLAKILVSPVPHCGEGCIWRADIIVSFGVWCIHRILELSLMESRPELWGKYTYVLNRLQGILDAAFSKPRSPLPSCFCLQIPTAQGRKSNLSVPNSLLPPTAKPGRGKCTSASTLLDIIKDVEISVSSRKGRTGTAAGDVAFPKGKENLASVLKRYKRRLSIKVVGTHDGGPGSRKVPISTS